MITEDVRRAIDTLIDAALIWQRVLMTCATSYDGLENLHRAGYELNSAKTTLIAKIEHTLEPRT